MSRHGPYPSAHHSRYPWTGGHSESMSSSASSQTYHAIPTQHYVQVGPYWERDGQYQLLTPGQRPPDGPTVATEVGAATGITPAGVYLLPRPLPPRPNHFTSAVEIGAAASGRRSRPLSSGGGTTPVTGETAVLPCGGHCIALETFCHHLLQVAFVACVLTGVCLVVAGSALKGRGRRGPDLSVLTYIGALVALVAGLLLAIQCCSRPRSRGQRARIRALHHQSTYFSPTTAPREDIPLQTFPASQQRHNTLPRAQPCARLEAHSCRNDVGIPWWRRENESPS